ncbi:MAG: hypothetical protein IBX63_09450 [Coriobacteriia bacterium]|nr:hypothetical protein [Coriobacteriia bacterium]
MWGDVKPAAVLAMEAPASLAGRERSAWGKRTRAARLEDHLERIDAALPGGVCLSVERDGGEVRFLAGGAEIVTVYEDEVDAAFLAAQWRQVARTTNVTDKYEAKTLMKSLLALRTTENRSLREQVVKLDDDIRALDAEIDAAEREMNGVIYRLYDLSESEIKLVEA